MAEIPKQFPRTVWLGMTLAFGLLGLTYIVALTKMERARQVNLPVIGRIADFTLTNQDGKITTLADLSNHVWVADIIFTRCAGPCPRMTGADEIAARFAATGERSKTRDAHDRSRQRHARRDEKIR